MDLATKFVLNLKSYFDTIPSNVWYDFEKNLLFDRVWDEDCILRSSIIRDGIDCQIPLQEANRNPIYKLRVLCKDYGGRKEETITGADLAIIFRLSINSKIVSQRVILVQLKRAYFTNSGTEFSALHEVSGRKYYGKDFHQAQRMLFFSSTPVYWFATTSAILEDSIALSKYSQKSNMARMSDSNHHIAINSVNYQLNVSNLIEEALDITLINNLNSLVKPQVKDWIENELDHFYYYRYSIFHALRLHLNQLQTQNLWRDIELLQENIYYQFWHLLRSQLRQHEANNFGMPYRIGLFVNNAEDIYSLYKNKNKSFASLYPKSIPFTQFVLGNILGNEFGDPNHELIDAILNRDVSGYFRNRVQQIAESYDFDVPDDFDDLLPVHHAVVMTLHVGSTTDEEDN